MSVAGSIVSGFGQLLSGFAANAAGRQQYRALNQAADQARYEAGVDAALTLEAGQRAAGDLVASAGASGGGTAGSSLDALRDLQRQISVQARNQIVTGNNRSQRLRYEARVAKRQGVLAQDMGMLEAGASFMNAFDQKQAGSKL